MMVGGGILAGVVLILIEMVYKRYRGTKEKELELARNAVDKWRALVEVGWFGEEKNASCTHIYIQRVSVSTPFVLMCMKNVLLPASTHRAPFSTNGLPICV